MTITILTGVLPLVILVIFFGFKYFKTSKKSYLANVIISVLIIIGFIAYNYDDQAYSVIELYYNQDSILIDMEYKREEYDGKKLVFTPKENYTLDELVLEISDKTSGVHTMFDSYGYIYLEEVALIIFGGEDNEFTISVSYHSIGYSDNDSIEINFPIIIIESINNDRDILVVSGDMNDLIEYYTYYDNAVITGDEIVLSVIKDGIVVEILMTYQENLITFMIIE